MMRFARLPLAAGVVVLMFGCRGDTVSPPIGGPMAAVSDGAHGGNRDFFFLPPLFKNPSSDPHFEPTAFNAHLRPTVEICELAGDRSDEARSCGPLVRSFAGNEVRMTDGHYQVNWHTDESNLLLTEEYRIRVLVGTTELGFADVDPVSSGKDLKSLQTGAYIVLVDGRTLPIKFRIENRALCIQDGCGAAAAGTINLAAGGGIELVAEGERFRLDIPAGTKGTSGDEIVTDVTFNLEVCGGIEVDLPIFGKCLRVTTFFGTAGPQAPLVLTNPEFSNPALISMCLLEPLPLSQEDQEDLITLHQQDGVRIRALPHARPNCEVIGARTQESPGLAARGWRWIRDIAGKLLTPRPLYARSRTVVFNLGGGGETDRFGAECSPSPVAKQMLLAECPAAVAPQLAAPAAVAVTGSTVSDFQFALPAQMDPLPGTGGQTAAPGSPVATPPGVRVTDAHGDPVANATVHFEVTAGNGSVTPLAVTSNAQGIAQVTEWVLGDAGTNTVRAFGFGIAGPDDGGPFMPDIELPPTPAAPRCVPGGGRCQEAVVLATGEVEFTATGTPPAALIDCAGVPGGDLIGRGFYVPEFPGTSLDRATLHFSARTAGTYTLSLTARGGTYDGPVLGTATATVTLTADDRANVATTFTFASPAVTQGSTVTFSLAQVDGPTGAEVFYSVPVGDPTCPVVQTEDTTPPLSTFRRQGVHVRIEGAAPAPVIP